jgi:hypothetical protein
VVLYPRQALLFRAGLALRPRRDPQRHPPHHRFEFTLADSAHRCPLLRRQLLPLQSPLAV